MIYDFGKTPGLIDESRASFGQTQQDYAGTRQQVVLDARTAYFGYLAAQRAQKVQEDTVKQNQDLLKQAQGFYKVGLKAKIDVTKAEANLYQAEANLIQAKNNVQLAQVTLMTALGLKTWPFSQVEDVLEVTTQPRSLEELKAMALQRRPEIQKNRFQQKFNEAGVQVARSGYFPTLTSTAAYGWQSVDQPFATQPSNWYVGAALTVPLFEGLSTAYSLNQNKAQLRASRRKLRSAAAKRHQRSQSDLSERQDRLGTHPGHQEGAGGRPGKPAPGLGTLPGGSGHDHRVHRRPGAIFPGRLEFCPGPL